MKPIDLLFSIGELNKIYNDSSNLQAVLDKTLSAIARALDTQVCSIYIYDENTQYLTLHATVGLAPSAVGYIKLKLDDSLVGMAVKESRTVYDENAAVNPAFRPFRDANDELFRTFLAVPIIRGPVKLGALVLRREKGRAFSEDEIKAAKVIASQLANMIDNARLMLDIGEQFKKKPFEQITEMTLIKGKVASEGFFRGEIFIMNLQNQFRSFQKMKFDRIYTKDELLNAVKETERNLASLQKHIDDTLSDAASMIFAAHLLMLKDPKVIGEITKLVDAGENPPTAVIKVISHFVDILLASKNDYIKEKVFDIEDVAIRVLKNLIKGANTLPDIKNKIVIARELLLSDLVRIYFEKAGGIVLMEGGVTSHLSILARTLKIPVVITGDTRLTSLPRATTILLDAETGNIFINPSAEISAQYAARNKARLEIKQSALPLTETTYTKDKTRVKLMININLLTDLKTAEHLPYDGIGLYRTEFPFLMRRDFPDEEQQFGIYKKLIDGAKGKPVVIRTLDIGGDKALSYYNAPREQNPFLGLRSIRFSLKNPGIFKQQVRAILRAGRDKPVKVMFPMISSIEEFTNAKNIVKICSEELEREGVPYAKAPSLGMMVEVPSVIELIDAFAEEADFFSIGTNDFIQYILAIDRTNEQLSDSYIAHHPAVLRALEKIITSCDKHGKEVSVCGDMANKPEYLAFLIGAGIREISIEPAHFPKIQNEIALIDTAQAQTLARKALKCGAIGDVETLLFGNRKR